MNFTNKLASVGILFMMLTVNLSAQNVEGDWMSSFAEYVDGNKLPGNHPGRYLLRYIISNEKVTMVSGTMINDVDYSVRGGILYMGPRQQYKIEEVTDKTLEMVSLEANPVRYVLVSTDSFTLSGRYRYTNEVVEGDTIYNEGPGIQPLFDDNFMQYLYKSISGISEAAFQFSFVVKKDGTIGAIDIKSSIKPGTNKRLIKAVQKSSGKWKPGRIGDRPIDVRVNSNFSVSVTARPGF